jgi:hypothetical protein
VTELSENRNKFYSMELHEGNEKGKSYYRIYTHYGRTDLLDDSDSTPNAPEHPAVSDESPDLFVERKECRYLHSLQQASVRPTATTSSTLHDPHSCSGVRSGSTT